MTFDGENSNELVIVWLSLLMMANSSKEINDQDLESLTEKIEFK